MVDNCFYWKTGTFNSIYSEVRSIFTQKEWHTLTFTFKRVKPTPLGQESDIFTLNHAMLQRSHNFHNHSNLNLLNQLILLTKFIILSIRLYINTNQLSYYKQRKQFSLMIVINISSMTKSVVFTFVPVHFVWWLFIHNYCLKALSTFGNNSK